MSSYSGDMFEDPFEIFITKIGCAKGTIFYLESMSKLRQRTIMPRWRTIEKFNFTLILLLSGDVSTNPGPIRHPCVGCGRPVKCNQQALMCDFCDKWVHRKCTNPLVCESDFFRLEDSTDNFYCQVCDNRLPEFSESFFHNSSLGNETFSSNLSNLSSHSGEESESCLAYTVNEPVHRITANHHKPPQTTPNHRKPLFSVYKTQERGWGWCVSGPQTTFSS